MNVRTKIKSGQTTLASNIVATVNQNANVAQKSGFVNVGEAINIAVVPQTNVATIVSTGAVTVSVNVNA